MPGQYLHSSSLAVVGRLGRGEEFSVHAGLAWMMAADLEVGALRLSASVVSKLLRHPRNTDNELCSVELRVIGDKL